MAEYTMLECPFCGGKPKLRVDNIKIQGHPEKAAWVYCTQCRAKTNYFRKSLFKQEFIDRAVIAWNMRVEEWYSWYGEEEDNPENE